MKGIFGYMVGKGDTAWGYLPFSIIIYLIFANRGHELLINVVYYY